MVNENSQKTVNGRCTYSCYGHSSGPPSVANVASVAGPSFSAPICAASTELSRRCPDVAAVVGSSRSGARCEHDAIVAVPLDALLGHRFEILCFFAK